MQFSKAAQHGDIDYYIRAISKFPLLNKEEEGELADRCRKGDGEAERKMIESNLRLVVKVASEFSHMGVPLQDLINEGNIGLMKAVRKFDPAKGKLSTYAVWWIKQCIRRAVGKNNRTVRLPVHMHDKISKIRKIKDRLREHLGREPTDYEVSEETGIDTGKISIMFGWGGNIASLDAGLGDEEKELCMLDLLRDENAAEPGEACQDADMSAHVAALLSQLREREREVVCRRFGIGCEAETLEEIGEGLKITRERVRQIQADALRRMLKNYRTAESRAKRKQLVKSGVKKNRARKTSDNRD